MKHEALVLTGGAANLLSVLNGKIDWQASQSAIALRSGIAHVC